MKKVIGIFVVILVLSLAGSVCAFETPPLFYLVAGSYLEKENAETRQEELYMYRYYSTLMGYPIDGVTYWRVIIAQDKSKENLEGMKMLLKEDGFETFYAYDSGDEPERPVENPKPIPVPPSDTVKDDIKDLIQKRFGTLEQFLIWLYDAL